MAGNVEEARLRLAFAGEQVAAAQADLQAGNRGRAVVAARAVEDASGQAAQLLDAVERLKQDLGEAAGKIATELAETRRDLAEARSVGGDGTLAAAVAAAEAAMRGAEQAAAPAGGQDPLAALLRLKEAGAALDQALQGIRDEQQRQQSIFGRIAQLTRANINAILDSAEDPEKMLDQMIRDYTDNIAEAEQAVAQTIGNLRLMEEDSREADETGAEWGAKAAAAKKGQELRAAGSAAEGDKFDNLARIALKRQLEFESQVKHLAPTIAQQNEVVERLKGGLENIRGKLDELKSKRDELVARAKMATAQAQVHDAIKSVDILDPTSEVSRFEEKIRREEAKVAGQAELDASALDVQFESLDDVAEDAEVEARLAALTARTTTALPTGSSTPTTPDT